MDSVVVGSPHTHQAFNLLTGTSLFPSLETNRLRTACVHYLFALDNFLFGSAALHRLIRKKLVKKVLHMVRAMGSAPAVPHIPIKSLVKRFARKRRINNRLAPSPQAYNTNLYYRKPVTYLCVCSTTLKNGICGLHLYRLTVQMD